MEKQRDRTVPAGSYQRSGKSRSIEGLYNQLLREEWFPRQLKLIRLMLMHKPRRMVEAPSDFRPLYLISTLVKLLEGPIVVRLEEALDDGEGSAV